MREKIVQTAGRDQLSTFAPMLFRLAIEVKGEDASTEWCEPVSGKAYGRLA